MKKAIIFLSILLSGFYLTSAINLDLSSGDKLDSSNWDNVSSITEKLNLTNNNLNVDGKLVSSGKICILDKCLGECDIGYVWDNNTSTCIIPATTQETAGTSCYTIKQANSSAEDGIYWLDPNGGDTTDAFEAYCDMTGGGWTLVIRGKGQSNISEYVGNAGDMLSYNQTDPAGETFKFSDDNINLLANNVFKIVADGHKSCTKYYSAGCDYTSNIKITSRNDCMKSYTNESLTSGLRNGSYYQRSGLSDRTGSGSLSIVSSYYPKNTTTGWYMEKGCSSNSGYGRYCMGGNHPDCNFNLWVK